MSSDPPGLCNLDYVPRYESVLAENLPAGFTRFADFFAGTQRLHTLAALLERHVHARGLDVLDVGSGPFASEIFVRALQNQSITALDYTPEFEPFHRLFRAEGHLATTTFRRADVMRESIAPNAFDLVILHDIFYEPALDLEAVIARLAPSVRPGGLVFLDFVNARTRWLWAMLGRAGRFARYDPRRVARFVDEAGFDVVAWSPTHGAKSRSARLVHAALGVLGASNTHAVLMRARGR